MPCPGSKFRYYDPSRHALTLSLTHPVYPNQLLYSAENEPLPLSPFAPTYATPVNNPSFGASRSLCLTFISLFEFLSRVVPYIAPLQQEPPIPSVSCPLLVSVGPVPLGVPRVHRACWAASLALIPPFTIPYPFFRLSLLPLLLLDRSFTSTPGIGHGTAVGLVGSFQSMDIGRFLLVVVHHHLTPCFSSSPFPLLSLPLEITPSLVHAYAPSGHCLINK